MRDDTRNIVDDWWRDEFDVGDQLWSSVSVVQPHRLLGDYEGWYVAWRASTHGGEGVHVSAPTTADTSEVAWLAEQPASTLQVVEFWQAFASARGLEVIGPSTHHYLDEDPGRTADVVEVSSADLEQLRHHVRPEEWIEGGMADDPSIAFGIAEDGVVVAAACLTDWRDLPSDIGVVVAATNRGRGLAAHVGRAAASGAVREQAVARWRAAITNVASTRTALRLGFEPYATQLAVRRAASVA